MKICGIAAEYNPFHNGHRHHIERTREAGATHVVAVMSGSFTQRAEAAVLPKFERARAAVLGGVDLVIELPVPYATASAERFAFGAVSLLDALGCVDMLSFGSECGDIEELKTAREALSDRKVQKRTAELTELGDNFPVARAKALEVFYPSVKPVLESPNNILAIEYLKALSRLSSSIEPFTVTRRGAGHDDETPVGGFASAGFIRGLIMNDSDTSIYVPQTTYKTVYEARVGGRISCGLAYSEAAVLYKLRSMTREEFSRLADCDTGLGDRLFAASSLASTLEELYQLSKTKRYTMSRIKRAVLCAYLDMDYSIFDSGVPYARILAIGKGGEDILSLMDKRCTVPVSQSLKTLAEADAACARFAEIEARATDIFNLTLYPRGPKNDDLTQKLFKLEPEPPIEGQTSLQEDNKNDNNKNADKKPKRNRRSRKKPVEEA